MIRLCILAVLLSGLSSCLTFGETFEKIPPGIWRGVLILSNEKDGFDEQSGGELPFNFEVVYDQPDSFHIILHNGKERIEVRDISMGVDRRTARDTIRIEFPIYDSYITAQYEEDAIEGFWVVNSKENYRIPFRALHGQDYRFFQLPETPKANLTGQWDAQFEVDTENPEPKLGEFKQEGNHLRGTFLSNTGDYRFLEGAVHGDRLFLSVFDGSHAFLFEAKVMDDGSLTGIFRSGKHYKTYWTATRNDSLTAENFSNPLALTQMVSDKPFSLSLLDPQGNSIDISKGQFEGRPKIIQVMGTWCPNCKDETRFLLDYLAQHPDPGFEILGVAFERYRDTLKANQAIKTYRSKLNIPYPVVFGGSSNKAEALKTLPMLNEVIAYPTMIFLDRYNQVVAIHTGFSGPATSAYDAFTKEFDQLVSQMLSP